MLIWPPARGPARRADHRADLGGLRVEHDEPGLIEVAAAQRRDLLGDARLQHALEPEIERRVHACRRRARTSGGSWSSDPAREVRRVVRAARGVPIASCVARASRAALRGDHAALDEHLEHVVAAAQRRDRGASADRSGGRARDHGEQRSPRRRRARRPACRSRGARRRRSRPRRCRSTRGSSTARGSCACRRRARCAARAASRAASRPTVRSLVAEQHPRDLHRQRRAAVAAAAQVEPHRARDAERRRRRGGRQKLWSSDSTTADTAIDGSSPSARPPRAIDADRGQRRDLLAAQVEQHERLAGRDEARRDRTASRSPRRSRPGSRSAAAAAPRRAPHRAIRQILLGESTTERRTSAMPARGPVISGGLAGGVGRGTRP